MLISLLSLAAGLFLSVSHPLAPLPVTAAFLAAVVLFSLRSGLALFSLPVFLPLLDFSPWTGWLIVAEFDLLVLAVVAAGYWRMPGDGLVRKPRLLFLCLALIALAIFRGGSDTDLAHLDWFAGYTSPMNAIRVGKSFLWLALLWPLLRREYGESGADRAHARFFIACLLGCAGLVLSVLWERAFYPGLLDVSTPYRAVGLFWEMHFGGAAIDAYLVLLAPLLVWAWRRAASATTRFGLGVFILAFAYVCLTTFSRGEIAVIAGSVTALGLALAWRRWQGVASRRIKASGIVVVVLIGLEILLVFRSDSFMHKRVGEAGRDLNARWRHWSQGVSLLRTPADWVFGVGLGSLPARMTEGTGGLPLSGDHYRRLQDGRPVMTIVGPLGAGAQLSGLYELSQRVELISKQEYRIALDAFSQYDVTMRIQVCAQHLLYAADCASQTIRLDGESARRKELVVSGPQFGSSPLWPVAHGILKLSVLTPGARVDVIGLSMAAADGNLLRNGRFIAGAAGWYPMASAYFLPWHIDNLYVEILIESGLVGLLSFVSLVLLVAMRLILSGGQDEFAPYLLASVGGMMAVGLVISVVDMPRVLILFGLFLEGASILVGTGRQVDQDSLV